MLNGSMFLILANWLAQLALVQSGRPQFTGGEGSSSVTRDTDCVRDYIKISGWLVRNSGAYSPEENIDFCERGLHDFSQGIQNGLDSSLVDSLNRLIALKSAIGNQRCTEESMDILSENMACARAISSQSNPGVERIIEYYVIYYTQKHAELCRDVYPAKLAHELARLPATVEPRVAEVMDRVAANHNEEHLDRIDVAVRSVEQFDQRDMASAVEALRSLLAHDPDSLQYLEKQHIASNEGVEKLEDIVHDYIFVPCRNYVQQLGPNIFLPYQFDNQSEPDEDEARAAQFPAFYRTAARFILCQLLMNGDRSRFVHGIIVYIEQ